LSSGGQAVTLGVNKQIGLRHIAISSGTAGHYSETLFKFNGAQYQKVKNRFVDLSSSSNGCKKPENKDVC
jgi:hypothetical protein